MNLLLVEGFLGSGKTTLVLQLARATTDGGQRVAILVNEIGEIGIDDQFMRRLGLSVWELYSGCICCTLSGDLVTTLQTLDAEYQPDLVILEPSGAAEPQGILRALPYYRGTPIEAIRTVCLIDPLRLPMLLEILTPLLTAQIRGADVLLINKTDLAAAEQVVEAQQAVADINPQALVLLASAKAGVKPAMLQQMLS